MKRFSKMILLLFVASTLFYGCDKDVAIEEQESAKKVDLSFNLEALGNQFTSNSLAKKTYTKADGVTEIQYPLCLEGDAGKGSYVKVTLNGVIYTLQFTALSPSQTEVIKVNAGSQIITEFEVFNSNNVAIYSAPDVTADADDIALYGLQGLPYTFKLTKFTKTKIEMDVICWHEYSYQPLGWMWYELGYNQKKTLCFFGDTCSKFFADWGADGYDFVTPFEVNLYSNGSLISTADNFTTQDILGTGPICIEYLDNELLSENLTFTISMKLPDGSVVVLGNPIAVAEGAWSSDDGSGNFGGADGIFDFTVGNCDSSGNNDEDFEFPSYLPLPAQADFKVSGSVYADGAYLKLHLRGFSNTVIASGFAIGDTPVGFPLEGWCASKDETITRGVWYPSNVYSSLKPNDIPVARYQNYNWGVLNWILNHKSGYTPQEVQKAIWHYTDVNVSANTLATAASSQSAYKPKVGEYALVLFDPIGSNGNGKEIQVFVVQVDP